MTHLPDSCVDCELKEARIVELEAELDRLTLRCNRAEHILRRVFDVKKQLSSAELVPVNKKLYEEIISEMEEAADE